MLDALLAAKLADHLIAFEAANPWRADALCLEYQDLDWFPAKGKSSSKQKAVCARCLVQRECREYATSANVTTRLEGIWAGTSGRQRQRARNPSARPPKPHAPRPLCESCGGMLPLGRVGRCCACEDATRDDPQPKPGVVAAYRVSVTSG